MRLCVLVLALAAAVVLAYDNGVADRPPMGWNSWCTDGTCSIDLCTEDEVLRQAHGLVNNGLRALGYTYVLMDDCWNSHVRDKDGNLQPNATRFPHGMPWLVSQVHALGLKIGVYTCAGTQTCVHGLPGSYGHYGQDAARFAEWKLDLVKMDNCNFPKSADRLQSFFNMSLQLNSTGRPILFSLCEWGDNHVQIWGKHCGQMYRIYHDHHPVWSNTLSIINHLASYGKSFPSYTESHGFADPDFLMTLFPGYPHSYPAYGVAESRAEFSLWSLWSSPLVVATGVATVNAAKMEILGNTDVIAIDQEVSSKAGYYVFTTRKGLQCWTRPMSNGDTVILVLNPLDQQVSDIVNMTKAGVPWTVPGVPAFTAKDLWTKKVIPAVPVMANVTLAAHDVWLIRGSLVPELRARET